MPELALGSSDVDVAPGLCEPYASRIRAGVEVMACTGPGAMA